MDWLKWLSALALIATTFAQLTTGIKNVKEIKGKKKKRLSPQKKRR